jgi:hypothetical protein
MPVAQAPCSVLLSVSSGETDRPSWEATLRPSLTPHWPGSSPTDGAAAMPSASTTHKAIRALADGFSSLAMAPRTEGTLTPPAGPVRCSPIELSSLVFSAASKSPACHGGPSLAGPARSSPLPGPPRDRAPTDDGPRGAAAGECGSGGTGPKAQRRTPTAPLRLRHGRDRRRTRERGVPDRVVNPRPALLTWYLAASATYRPFLAARLPCSMSFFIVWPPLRPIFS